MTTLLSLLAYKIINVLRNHPQQKFKEIELIQAARTGKGAAGLLINKLVQEGILQEQRVGRAKMISWHLSNPSAFFLKNLLDQEKMQQLPPQKLAAMLLFQREANPSLKLMVVFGSTTAGTTTPQSDIDLLIVSDNLPLLEKARQQAEEYTDERLNLHIYNETEFKEKVKIESFVQNALFQGIILKGYDFVQEIYLQLNAKNKELFTRLDYFKERLAAARRNYSSKDRESAQEIISRLLEQLVFYLLTSKVMAYQSKKDALKAIKKTPEGRVLMSITKSPLKEKIDKLDQLIKEITIKTIREERGYGH
ncbi:MAG: nucleotidyltransferase domain-containing protein [Nanoarchaeota archaeon]